MRFLIGSTVYAFAGGNNCGGWTSVGSWSASFNAPATSSTTCNSYQNTLSLAAGFTQVCIVNACGGGCDCADYVNFAGQIQLNGYSTTTALNTATITNPICVRPTRQPTFTPTGN